MPNLDLVHQQVGGALGMKKGQICIMYLTHCPAPRDLGSYINYHWSICVLRRNASQSMCDRENSNYC
jgi:hypothetical protein